ncbi:hypothetical protein HPG69_012146 [Diceros bicornis minor]|uniref:Cytochrome b-c1 complex subunit 10 n=1 Tax=Diceros bicornis minor TaxID=77932 RepID=A0A7J7EZH7_DICBM|nr:hypothetical protein HPG69_012146 [Diceros bicornis minor]
MMLNEERDPDGRTCRSPQWEEGGTGVTHVAARDGVTSAAGCPVPTTLGAEKQGRPLAVASSSSDRERVGGGGCRWTVALAGTLRWTLTVAPFSWVTQAQDGGGQPWHQRRTAGGPCCPSRHQLGIPGGSGSGPIGAQIPTVSMWGAVGTVGLVWATDWRLILDWVPYINGKFKKDD